MLSKSEYKAISIAIDVLNRKLELENSDSEDLIFAIDTLNRWKNRVDEAKERSQKNHDLFKFLSELSDKQRGKIIEHINNIIGSEFDRKIYTSIINESVEYTNAYPRSYRELNMPNRIRFVETVYDAEI